MPVEKQLYRSSPTVHASTHFQTLGNIDRENRAMFGVIGMQTGEALGHGVEADRKTLDMVAAIGNQRTAGAVLGSDEDRTGKEAKKIRQRFGHPGISENATGKQLAYADNFRVVGDSLLHDTHFFQASKISPVFTQDPTLWIMDMAEHSPEFLNESAVIDAELVWVLADGSERELSDSEYGAVAWGVLEVPEDATNDLPMLRPLDVVFFDWVTEGALTNTLMSSDDTLSFLQSAFSGTPSEYAHELWDLLDRFRESYSIPLDTLESKAQTILSKYVASRGGNVEATNNPIKDGIKMASKKDRAKLAQLALEGESTTTDDSFIEDEGGYNEEDVTVTEETVFEESEEDAGIVEASTEESATEDESTVDEDLAEIGDILADDPEDEAPEATVESEDFTALQGQVTALEHQLSAYEQRFAQLVGFMKTQAAMLQVLNRNQKRLSGETQVTQRVPTSNPGFNGLEEFEDFPGLTPVAPTPAGLLDRQGTQTIGKDQFAAMLHTDPAQLNLASDTPSQIAEKAVATQQNRQARYKMQNRS